MNYEEQAISVARSMWEHGIDSVVLKDPRTPDFASAALGELIECRNNTSGILEEVIQGAEYGASQLTIEDTHGLLEVVQNADDQKATKIRLGVRINAGCTQLVIAHNGSPVSIQDVAAMVFPFVTTKTDDPETTGKFGVGLKTLSRLTDRIEVHCWPYHFAIVGSYIEEIPATRIESFYEPNSEDTLLVLPLRDETLEPLVQAWARLWEAHHMLFLRHLRSLTWIDIPSGEPLFSRSLTERASDIGITLQGESQFASLRATEVVDRAEDRNWTRFDADVIVPPHMTQDIKAIGDTTTVSVAVPNPPTENVLFAWLPTKIPIRLPYTVNAAFHPNTARTQIQQNDWNMWLWERVTELVDTVVTQLLEESPPLAWYLIPKVAETSVPADSWVEERIENMSRQIWSSVCSTEQNIRIGASEVPICQVAYEDKVLRGLVSDEDFTVLAEEYSQLLSEARDDADRWREVMDELQLGKRLEIADALKLLPLCTARPSDRRPEWYVRIVSEALNADLGARLRTLPCILVDEPLALSTPNFSAPLYTADPVHRPLAIRLGLVLNLHRVLLGDCTRRVKIRKWLEKIGHVWHGTDADSLLEAIARRGSKKPLELSDEDLVELRDSIDEIENPDSELMGRVGKAVMIDAFEWNQGQRVQVKAPVSSVYLPSSIAGGTEPWIKAAGRTSGLKWAAPKYSKVLDTGDRQSGKSGARRTLGLLGALTVFRLERHAVRDYSHAIGVQKSALGRIHGYRKQFRNDYTSPDLESVIASICSDSGPRRYERSLALVDTIRRHWRGTLLQKTVCEAYYHYHYYKKAADVAVSWVVLLTDSTWLQNEEGHPATPQELTIRSQLTEGLFGDAKSRFAAGIQEDLYPDLVSSLGFQTDPAASEIVEILARFKRNDENADWAEMRRYYAYLNGLCPTTSTSVRSDTKVGDLTTGELRGKFGIRSDVPGLIAFDGEWRAPSAVFRGRAAFGGMRTFVEDGKSYEKLWNILRVREPNVSDCVAVLCEIAADEGNSADPSVLTDTYRHLSGLIPACTAKELRMLSSLPLWTASGWVDERPIFHIADETASQSLKQSHDMWEPPCSLEGMEDLVQALDVSLIPSDSCVPTGAGQGEFILGSDLKDEFSSRVSALKGFLASSHPDAYRAIDMEWEALENTNIAVAKSLGLEISLPTGEEITAKTNAYLQKDPPAIYVSSEGLLYDYNAGARVISECLQSPEHRQIVRLAWSNPVVMESYSGPAMTLAAEPHSSEDPLDDLKPLVERNVGKTFKRRRESMGKSRTASKGAPIRQRKLKKLDTMSVATADIVNPHAQSGVYRSSNTVSTVIHNPSGPAVGTRPAVRTAPRGYTDDQREQLALEILERVVHDNSSILRDFTRVKGLGADAGDELGRLFEIKAYGREIPDTIRIQLSQVRAASENPDGFYLAIVSGLEEGYETVVKLFARPLETLDWQRGTTFSLSGIRSKKAIEVRLR